MRRCGWGTRQFPVPSRNRPGCPQEGAKADSKCRLGLGSLKGAEWHSNIVLGIVKSNIYDLIESSHNSWDMKHVPEYI